MAEDDKPASGDGRSWIPIVLFWLGVGVYYSGIDDWLRDRFQVQPAMARAAELKASGGAEPALDILLEQLPANPENPKLLWSLGNTYTSLDRPVLAALYFQALERTGKSSQVDSLWLDYTSEWRQYENPARKQVRKDEEQLAADFASFQRDYESKILEHPADINAVLALPAANPGPAAGYIPPEHPASCGPAEPNCGYGLDIGRATFQSAIINQSIRIEDPRGGRDCCTLKLDDPDLRSLSVAEEEFVTEANMIEGRLATDTEEGRRLRLAFGSRALLKQQLVLDFIESSDKNAAPDPGWTIWSWVKLIGWFALVMFLTTYIEDLLDRGKARMAKKASSQSADPAKTSVSSEASEPRSPLRRRLGFAVLALLLAIQAVANFSESNLHRSEANTIVVGMDTLSAHMRALAVPGNSVNLAAGVSVLLCVLLAINRGWRSRIGSSGPVDRLLGFLSGTGGRMPRMLSGAFTVLALAWLLYASVGRTSFHFSAADAAQAFKDQVAGTSIRVNGSYVQGLSLDESKLHIAAFGPPVVRAFEKADIAYGYTLKKFEFPVPGTLPLFGLALLCGLAAWRNRAKNFVPAAFLAAGLLQCYLLFWLSSSQQGIFLAADGWLDEGWVGAAFPLLAAQLVVLAALHRMLRERLLPASQRAGWMSLYFAAAVLVQILAYRVSDAPWLTPTMLWLSTCLVLWSGLCWLLLRRLAQESAP